jgi:predicted transcriptional regulator
VVPSTFDPTICFDVAQLSLAGLSNIEIANLLDTTAQVVSQMLYESRRSKKKIVLTRKPLGKGTKKLVLRRKPLTKGKIGKR